MAKEKCLFDRLDDINVSVDVVSHDVLGIKEQVNDTHSEIRALKEEIERMKANQAIQSNRPATSYVTQNRPQPSEKELFQAFLKQSRKSWRWFGPKKEFQRQKLLAIISIVVLLMVGFITTFTSTYCFKIYSTFTFFENIAMIVAIIYLVYACKSKQVYEVNAMASSTPFKYETDNVGMKFQRKEKAVFRIFKWLAIISVICNVIVIWYGMGREAKVLATIMEVLFLGSIIFVFLANIVFFYSGYSIAQVDGYNMRTKEKVTLVLPPGFKQLMTEEEFKNRMPIFYE